MTADRRKNVADKILLWLAYRLPRRLVLWCAVRVGANATTGEWNTQVVPDLLFMDALKRWDRG